MRRLGAGVGERGRRDGRPPPPQLPAARRGYLGAGAGCSARFCLSSGQARSCGEDAFTFLEQFCGEGDEVRSTLSLSPRTRTH